jgi:hypothetical protein
MNLLLLHRDFWMRKKSLPLALALGKPCFDVGQLRRYPHVSLEGYTLCYLARR